MSPECQQAARQIHRDLLKHEAKFTAIGTTLLDDIRSFKSAGVFDPWAWETTMRRAHIIITRTIANLPLIQLYHLALLGNPKALWKFPHTHADTIPNRTKLIAHAMKNILRRTLI